MSPWITALIVALVGVTLAVPVRAESPPTVQQRGILQFGLQADAVLFKDGALAGPGAFVQMRLAQATYLHAAISLPTACSKCTPIDLSRTDLVTTLGVQYYLREWQQLAVYLRGALTYRIALYTARDEALSESLPHAHLMGTELGLGLDWRLGSWVILGVDAAYLFLGRVFAPSDSQTEHMPPGLPSLHRTNHAVTLRLNLGLRF